MESESKTCDDIVKHSDVSEVTVDENLNNISTKQKNIVNYEEDSDISDSDLAEVKDCLRDIVKRVSSKCKSQNSTEEMVTATLKRPTEGESQSSTGVRFKKLRKTNRRLRNKKDTNSVIESENDNAMDVDSGKEENTNHKTSDSSSSSSSDDLSSTSSSNTSSDSEDDFEKKEKPVLTDDEVWLKKEIDKPGSNNWVACTEVRAREYGVWPTKFTRKLSGACQMVKRFRQLHTLEAHEGCVNSLHFNESGTMLASGSDDLTINLWNWHRHNPPIVSFDSGHKSNVFQSKFLPGCCDSTVVSCARDGQVRVADISTTGSCRATRKVAQHRGSAHKLALDTSGSRTRFFSCGEDSVVFGIDLRDENPATKLVSVRNESNKVPLYSIQVNPVKPYEFAVSGRDEWARIYDHRMVSEINDMPLKRFCPHHLVKPAAKNTMKANVTCLVYNYDGTELLCSYNDEDIYLFNCTHSSGDDYIRRYKGHRNSATVKGVNFYGPKSEFVVSGSDCGHVFLWEKSTSQIVQFLEGDQGGVVNVLEPHPHLPVLATSGLDNDIKIFAPIGEALETIPDLRETILLNRQERQEDLNSNHNMDGNLLWFLMRSLNTRHRDRNRPTLPHSSDSSSDNESNSSGDYFDDRQNPCVTS